MNAQETYNVIRKLRGEIIDLQPKFGLRSQDAYELNQALQALRRIPVPEDPRQCELITVRIGVGRGLES